MPLFFLKISNQKLEELKLLIGGQVGMSFAFVALPEGLDDEYKTIVSLKVAIHELYHSSGTKEVTVRKNDIQDEPGTNKSTTLYTRSGSETVFSDTLNHNTLDGGILEEGGAVKMEKLFEEAYLPTIDIAKREEYLNDTKILDGNMRLSKNDEGEVPYYRIIHSYKEFGNTKINLGTKDYMESRYVFELLEKTIPNFNKMLESDYRKDGFFWPLYSGIKKVYGEEIANEVIRGRVRDASDLYQKLKSKTEELNLI